VLSTYNSLTKSNKSSLRDIISEIEPEKGPWGELLTLLRNCDEAFNESSAAITAKGLPLNRIACISHMLCDEKFLASVRIQLVCGCNNTHSSINSTYIIIIWEEICQIMHFELFDLVTI
jgi:hypothetical protein